MNPIEDFPSFSFLFSLQTKQNKASVRKHTEKGFLFCVTYRQNEAWVCKENISDDSDPYAAEEEEEKEQRTPLSLIIPTRSQEYTHQRKKSQSSHHHSAQVSQGRYQLEEEDDAICSLRNALGQRFGNLGNADLNEQPLLTL